MGKRERLREVAEEIEGCEECKKYRIGLPIPGEGNPNASIVFMGEAGGPTESKTGKPFVGRSGRFLTKMLEAIGIKREEVFITSPVKYYPGKRAPTKKEILHGMLHTRKQIEIIDPKIIVLLGKTAVFAFLGDEKISEVHGRVIKKDRVYFPTFHPSAAMRFPRVKRLMEADFKKLKKILISG